MSELDRMRTLCMLTLFDLYRGEAVLTHDLGMLRSRLRIVLVVFWRTRSLTRTILALRDFYSLAVIYVSFFFTRWNGELSLSLTRILFLRRQHYSLARCQGCRGSVCKRLSVEGSFHTFNV